MMIMLMTMMIIIATRRMTPLNGHVALSCTQATLMQMTYNTTIAYNRPRAYLAQESPPPLLEEQLQRDMFLVYY